MKTKKFSETIKKYNKEIVERMKRAVHVKKDIDLTINSDITKSDINSFKSHNNRAFYKRIVDFGIRHGISVNWLMNGEGEMCLSACLPPGTVYGPGAPYTPEEQGYIGMALDVLRGVNEQDKNSLIMNIASFHQHYQERREIDEKCLEDLKKNIQKQEEGDIKKAHGC